MIDAGVFDLYGQKVMYLVTKNLEIEENDKETTDDTKQLKLHNHPL